MSHKAHDHVHRLVRSMSRAEKRYYKVHTGRGMAGRHCIQHKLFDAIAAMAHYDEEALVQRFAEEAFTNRFAITKRRLYESVLRSLDAFHAETSIDARLGRSLHHVEILHQRALYDDAAKVLAGVARSARQHDRQAILCAVLEWERRLLEGNNYASAEPGMLEDLAENGRTLRDELEELDKLWHLKSGVLLALYTRGQARDTAGCEEVRQLLDHPLLSDRTKLRTAKARYLYHHIHSAASFALGDLSVCYKHLHANRDLLATEMDRFVDEPSAVLGVLSNLTYVCIRTGRYDEAQSVLREFRSIPMTWGMPETEDLELKLFSTSTSLELSMHCQVGSFSKALDLLPGVERRLAAQEDRIGPVRKAGFLYQIAYIYFGAGQVDQSLKWVHRLLNEVHIDESTEIVCFGRILHILGLWESGKHDQIPYTLRNTERFLHTRHRTHRFELLFLKMMRALLKAGPGMARTTVLQQFLEELRPIEADPMEQVVFDHLDPIAWAESKLGANYFADAVQERALRAKRAA